MSSRFTTSPRAVHGLQIGRSLDAMDSRDGGPVASSFGFLALDTRTGQTSRVQLQPVRDMLATQGALKHSTEIDSTTLGQMTERVWNHTLTPIATDQVTEVEDAGVDLIPVAAPTTPVGGGGGGGGGADVDEPETSNLSALALGLLALAALYALSQ